MLAHVTYPAVAPEPAGYSPRWIKDILRGEMRFRGVVFSDDIGMAAAESAGGVAARIDAHLDAGCDAVLVCAPALVPDSLNAMDSRSAPAADTLAGLFGRGNESWSRLEANPRYAASMSRLSGDESHLA